MMLISFPANAGDGNVLVIEQSGDGNSLSVDQSGATNSFVGGLEIQSGSDPIASRSVTYVYDVSKTRVKTDETGETVYDDQNQPVMETYIDQETVVVDTLSAGLTNPDAESGAALRQLGIGNEASIVVTGTGGQVGLYQDNRSVPGWPGNSATISASERSAALVGQLGGDNSATLNVGIGGSGTILQQGNGNVSNLTVGEGAKGLISQLGNNNETALTVPAGGDASYIVDADNAVSLRPEGVSVLSNVPGIVVRQTR